MQQTLKQFRDRLRDQWPVAARAAVAPNGDADCTRTIIKWPGNEEVTYDVPLETIRAVMSGS